MKKTLTIMLVFIICYTSIKAQTNLLWGKHFNGQSNYWDVAVDMKIDNDNNIVVAGITGTLDTSSVIFDIVIIKYTPTGDSIWTKVYSDSGNGSCEVISMTIDPLNNIYLTGFIERNFVKKMLTIKYDSNGNKIWEKEYGSTNIPFVGQSILYHNSNAIYVVGNGGIPNSEDIHLIKYNSNGDTLWTRSLSYSQGGYTIAQSAALDQTGNIFIAGNYLDNGAIVSVNFLTVKYNAAGDTSWIRTYDGPANGYDFINVVKTDNLGNVYVSGLSEADHGGGAEGDYATIKYDNNGNEIWVARYDGGYGGEYPVDLLIDNVGFVYVTGWSISDIYTKAAATIKYNPTGQQQWVYRYNGDGYYFNEPSTLGITQSGILLVAGGVSDTEYTQDWVLVAINKNSGDSIWTVRYDGSGNVNDLDTPSKMIIDGNDNIYISGFTAHASRDWDITTLKYSPPGPLSVDEIEIQPSIFIYPNPTSGILNISSSEKIMSIEIYNILGEKIYTNRKTNYQKTNIVNLLGYSTGIYIVRFNIGGKDYTKKIILR